MVLLQPLLFVFGAGTLVAYAFHYDPLAFQRQTLYRRAYISSGQRSSSYDFVIAGGGLAGLVVAARLSDDPNLTVLVLEAGPSGDEVADKINTPSGTYYQSIVSTAPYDWLFTSTPQTNMGGRSISQPRGKVIGGSSAINGMYYVRPSQQEINAWHDLIAPANSSAADVWTRDSFFTAIKNTETFTPPSADLQSQMGIRFSQNSRGSSGKLHASYPGYMPPLNGLWLPTLQAAGIPSNPDPDSGSNLGGFITSSTINPSNWTRSYPRNAYIDNLPPRQNLHIISNATVSRVLFGDNDSSGNKVVRAIEFSSGRGTDVQTVSVNKEAILAGGAYGSPQILQVSGIGPPDILQAANVTVQLELPGVGQHLLDHLAVPVFFNTSAVTAGAIHDSNSDFSKTSIFNAFVNDAIAYVNGSKLFDGDASFAAFRSQIDADFNNSVIATRVPSNHSEVIEGYKAIHLATVQNIYPTAGIVELIFSINSPGILGIQIALQQGLSQGRTYITTPSIYDSPTIDPGYLSHPSDIIVLRQGIKLARVIASLPPISVNITAEFLPGAQVQADGDVETYIRTQAASEFHPAGTCAMLPRDKGGVVDAQFKVYGVKNLRVIDSSVFPVSLCAHLMSSTYALAETGARLILNEWKSPNSTTTTSTTTTKKGWARRGIKTDLIAIFIIFASVLAGLAAT